MECIRGKSIFEDIVIGEPYLRKKRSFKIKEYKIDEANVDNEIARFGKALEETKSDIKYLKNSLKGKVSDDEIKILKVHLMVLDDPVLLSEINTGISKELKNAEIVVDNVVNKYIDMFGKLKDPVYRQRAIDIKDIGEKLINHLLSVNRELEDLDGKILFAKEVFPSELLKLHHKGINLKGVVTEYGGDTSHVAILAKALQIPTLMGVKGIKQINWEGTIILDTRKEVSCVIKDPTPEVLEKYMSRIKKLDNEREEFEKLKLLPTETLDNNKINLFVNVGGNLDLGEKIQVSSEGIGLLRSEFLYIDSEFFPSEEKQMEIYEKIYSAMGDDTGKSLTIRTLDIGADKKLDYYEMPEEENPSLGLRGLRFTLAHKNIFKDQLRAILRVAYNRNIKIMYPMVTTLAELDEAEEVLNEVKRDLESEGLNYKKDIEVGIMVEVPSVIMLADLFAPKVDFFSIGTNDLTQYILATDRLSSEVAPLYDGYDPAVLRSINQLVEAATKYGKKVSVCGEMAGEPMAILAFLSFGITNLSMIPSFVPRAKGLIRKKSLKEIKEIKEKILVCESVEQVKKLLKGYVKG